MLNYLYFSFPKIKLIWVKMTNGSYSHSYITKYKAITKRNPYSYCIAEDVADRLLPFYLDNEKYPEFKSAELKNPLTFDYFTSFSEIKKELGKPNCFQSYKISGVNIKIAGYRPEIFGKISRLYIYFVDDVFFMNEYVFKRLKEQDIARISAKLIEMAGAGTKDPPTSFYVKNDQKVTLFYRDAAFSQIASYLSRQDANVENKLRKIINEITKFRDKLEDDKF
ncbi:MAG: hypothetical protein U5Q03_03465 [Bacteroidota bacterium]|nr:hypothetical protein [Bacteroidota bacterium]